MMKKAVKKTKKELAVVDIGSPNSSRSTTHLTTRRCEVRKKKTLRRIFFRPEGDHLTFINFASFVFEASTR